MTEKKEKEDRPTQSLQDWHSDECELHNALHMIKSHTTCIQLINMTMSIDDCTHTLDLIFDDILRNVETASKVSDKYLHIVRKEIDKGLPDYYQVVPKFNKAQKKEKRK